MRADLFTKVDSFQILPHKSLTCGNNIQEGHYAERSWAHLLSTPLEPFQMKALIDNSHGVYLDPSGLRGSLVKVPKIASNPISMLPKIARGRVLLISEAESFKKFHGSNADSINATRIQLEIGTSSLRASDANIKVEVPLPAAEPDVGSGRQPLFLLSAFVFILVMALLLRRCRTKRTGWHKKNEEE
ncbi:predicted protein [Thalassiosira pseudonana CCMP1335]|uniref:Uncharacterized protein n=1 Tax=Thalassiosira pseudonana TaxID=35128 RepID=B8LBK5_THAPS|nr:predicted protein [Thalassiosira pseudonana CCMP1335]EED87063.1 predicted protein [Thalassiosira pseudonana CCMP1335]|eukprot:g11034.t1 g11034   contig48:1283-1843(+)